MVLFDHPVAARLEIHLRRDRLDRLDAQAIAQREGLDSRFTQLHVEIAELLHVQVQFR